MLDLNVESYLFRSVSVTFGFGVRLVEICVLLVLANVVAAWVLQRGDWLYHGMVWTLAIVGLVTGSIGFYFALGWARPSWLSPIAPPVLLAVGAAFLLRWEVAYFDHPSSRRSLRISDPFRRSLVVALAASAVLATFWAATLYAVASGREWARADDRSRGRLPAVSILSKEFIDLPGENVKYTEITDPASNRDYRYTGLRLLAYSHDRWFLLTGRYDPTYVSTVAVVRDAESITVELANKE